MCNTFSCPPLLSSGWQKEGQVSLAHTMGCIIGEKTWAWGTWIFYSGQSAYLPLALEGDRIYPMRSFALKTCLKRFSITKTMSLLTRCAETWETLGKLRPNNDQFYVFGMTVFVETEKGILREVHSFGNKAGFHPPLAGLSRGVWPRWNRSKRLPAGVGTGWWNRAPFPLDNDKGFALWKTWGVILLPSQSRYLRRKATFPGSAWGSVLCTIPCDDLKEGN